MNLETLLLVGVRVLLAAGAIAWIYAHARTRLLDPPPAWIRYVAVNLVGVSIVLHLNVSLLPRPAVLVHLHDIFHYYVGSKYFPELGYAGLYPCAVAADAEDARPSPRFHVRRMEDYGLSTSKQILEERERYCGRFTAERWESFREDVGQFRRWIADDGRWRGMFQDNGYNATPSWTFVGRLLSTRLPLGSWVTLPLLVAVDLLLIALAFGLIHRTFGSTTAILAFGLFGTLFFLAPGHIRVSFLRLDWLAALLAATCLLTRGRYATAGSLVGYACMIRVLPVVCVFGLAAKWLWDVLRTRRSDPRYLRFFLGLTLAAAALFGLSLAGEGKLEDWSAFAAKIRTHDESVAANRVGFKYLFLAAADSPAAAVEQFRRFRVAWWSIQAVVLACSFVAVRRLADHETVPFGYVLAYFLTAPTLYYHALLVVLALLFLPRLEERARAHGAAALFGVSILGYVLWAVRNVDARSLLDWTPRRLPEVDSATSLSLSCALLAVALGVIVFALRRR